MVLPKNFGKYDVVGVLGAGAMGTVYDAVDPVIGRRVAIKTVLKHSLDASEAQALLDRFKQEAQAAGRLNHPGVCSIYDYGETEYVSFIAMEYISGKELKAYFDESHKFDLKEVVRIMTEILDALDHAHRNKVVHRDIKPANIMITDNGRVKVADFGVAKIESSMLTQVGTKVGTPAYMSPEQHKGLSADGRSDLFSCGVILYQFLTGKRPFTGGSHTVAQEILTRAPTPPSEINTSLTPVWDTIIKTALAKRRDERYLTARDFMFALAKGLNDTPGGVAVPFQTTTGTPSDATNASERSATSTGSDRSDRTNVAMMESELEFWKEIKDSDIEEDFAAFVESFPDGRFSHIAKRRLDKLRAANARSQLGVDLPSPAQASTALAPSAPAPSATAPALGEVDDDLTQMSIHNREAVDDADQPQPVKDTGQANAPTAGVQPAVDVDATMIRQLPVPASASAAQANAGVDADATMIRQHPAPTQAPAAKTGVVVNADADADATLLQRPGEPAGDALEADEEMIELDGSGDIDLDLSEEITALPPEAMSMVDAPAVVAAVAPEVAPAVAPVVAPVVAVAVSPDTTATTAPATPKEATPAQPPAALPLATPPAKSAIDPTSAVALAGIPVVKPAGTPVATPVAKSVAAPAAAPLPPKAPTPPTEAPSTAPPTKKSPVAMLVGVALALAAAGGGWFMFGSTPAPSPNPADIAGRETSAKKAADDAKKARDAAEQKKAEADAKKLADEKAAAKADADKSAADKLAKATAEKAAADKAAADKAVPDKAAADKAAANKIAADKANAEKLAAEKLAAEKAAADRLAAEKAAADKAAAEKLAADKAAADKRVADKAAADKVAAEKAAATNAVSIADRIAAASSPPELYKRAVALRSEGKVSQAVALLRQASSQGHGPSSKLLAVIFTDGAGDVRANFREVERYKELAEKQGER